MHALFNATVKHDNSVITDFTALDKCLPGRNCLEVIDMPAIAGTIKLTFDPGMTCHHTRLLAPTREEISRVGVGAPRPGSQSRRQPLTYFNKQTEAFRDISYTFWISINLLHLKAGKHWLLQQSWTAFWGRSERCTSTCNSDFSALSMLVLLSTSAEVDSSPSPYMANVAGALIKRQQQLRLPKVVEGKKPDFASKFDLYSMSFDYLYRFGNEYEALYGGILEHQEKSEFSAHCSGRDSQGALFR
ncbi:uncharacterized protein ARMOST_07072 [Armillaria ostoyae]|uniref:Lariat debranching enzyme C-terminal domain-containing protein n=1 Tax=Armillaria ostoyae TaxID=47428 RepID=A0A284R4T9_ARMOS|nr:uncharacterized protein ARMOST_07072 [Armillaria ostoyae]